MAFALRPARPTGVRLNPMPLSSPLQQPGLRQKQKVRLGSGAVFGPLPDSGHSTDLPEEDIAQVSSGWEADIRHETFYRLLSSSP